MTTTVIAKGQVTMPKRVLDLLGIFSGKVGFRRVCPTLPIQPSRLRPL